MSVQQVREFMAGHRQLHGQLSAEPRGYVGRRHMQRWISDFYVKGIARGVVESVNLLKYSRSKA